MQNRGSEIRGGLLRGVEGRGRLLLLNELLSHFQQGQRLIRAAAPRRNAS